MNIDMIYASAERAMNHVRRTPLLSSPFLDEIAGRRVLVKAECLQHTGSFKFRGGWSALSSLDEATRKRGVIAFSSGNHSQGVARAAALHGVPSVIVMPRDAPQLKIDNTRALGSEVVFYDRAGNESREQLGIHLAQTRGLFLIHPYDEPLVVAGQGTCGLEIADQADTSDAEVLVNCGGGGLTSGIALALEALAPEMKVRPVEPEGFDDVSRSLISGQREQNAANSGGLADAILTPSPGKNTFPVMQRLCGAGLVVSDKDMLRAMALAFLRLKIVLEPGGAASLAAALFHPDKLTANTAICVATGGNVDATIFRRALDTLKD